MNPLRIDWLLARIEGSLALGEQYDAIITELRTCDDPVRESALQGDLERLRDEHQAVIDTRWGNNGPRVN